MVTAYCVRCRVKTEMVNPKERTNAKNVRMLQGTCKECEAKVNTFIKRDSPPMTS